MARMALGIVPEIWIQSDPAAAFEALRDTPKGTDPHLRSTGLALVTEQWNRAAPAAVWKATGTLPPSIESAFLKARTADA